MIATQTRFCAYPFRMALALATLLLFPSLAQAQITTQQALETTLTMRRQAQPADAAPDPLYEFMPAATFGPPGAAAGAPKMRELWLSAP